MTWYVVRKTLPLSMPPEKQTPMGSFSGMVCSQLRDLFGEGGDVGTADGVEVGGERARWAG